MRIAVCIKQVPDSEARLRIDASGRWIDEEDISFVINESDEYALEEALTIAEQTGGEVVVFSLGPERVREALRKSLALGAARAVHLSDPAFEGGDATAVARALAAAVGGEEFDLILTGSQSGDSGFSSTGSMLAGMAFANSPVVSSLNDARMPPWRPTWCSPVHSPTTPATAPPARCWPATWDGRTRGW